MKKEGCLRYYQGQAIRSISEQGHNYRSIETSSGNTHWTQSPSGSLSANFETPLLKMRCVCGA